ncbi:hypothetical protein RGV33_01435 [Pseudomonas sp. Bout1]|uniref:esterase/lipase family protein n=1 Tax=Pseudomonas sp. Bout1 TaxID=3048600 RepID=UPI002AB36D04|nr:hypothetical protein [Pseudomonas sp. Bout1]MDY7530354.1 hypothetical protein [Pseudomonas sp. Bout1]MEB0188256.1 hypothetical protein [Pseudomonas sp. Bout1]
MGVIEELLGAEHLASEVSVHSCDSSDWAREELKTHFDLLILDVLIPKKSDGTASAVNSTKLLADICNPSKNYIRPSLTIGLTADIEYLREHQGEFQKNAIVVLDGSLSNIDWLDTLEAQVKSIIGAKRKIVQQNTDRVLITIHGIRTYGQWQESLRQEMKSYSREFEYVEVNYGFFDLISFSIPFLRSRKAKQVSGQVLAAFEANPDKQIYIVAHSFGTYVLSEALKNHKGDAGIKCVVMCGSPMPHGYDINHIVNKSELTINDCGISDGVLLAARFLLLRLGDAGRIGFRRSNTRKFINRYFKGGHSLYFSEYNESSFYSRFWTPSLAKDIPPSANDERRDYFGQDIVDLGIKLLTLLKPIAYISIPIIIINKIITVIHSS